jgi:acetyl esterase
MAMDPGARRVLELLRDFGRPPIEESTPQEARENMARSRAVFSPEPPEVGEIRALKAPGPAGEIPLRFYRGRNAPGSEAPALVYFHGGGWVLGDLDSHDAVCRRLANDAACVVVSVDYRLAPEHRFPAAVDDCAAATRWVVAEAASLGIDPARVAVGGDSAGGNLAAVIALMARDAIVPAIRFQLLIYPATDMAGRYPSAERTMSGLLLTTPGMRWFIDLYLNRAEEALDWRASPLRAGHLSGVAPAIVFTAYHDPLCDEGEAYGERLEREGVHVNRVRFGDQIHGFLTMGKFIPAADTMQDIASAALRQAWRT